MAVVTEQSDDQRRETRWSANKKTDAVLRLLRGESLNELSRQLRVEAHRLAAWRDEFLAAGKVGLKGRVPAEDGMTAEQRRRLREAERKVGELTLDNDILRAAARKRGLEIPPAKRPK
jgi:transposase-like protein